MPVGTGIAPADYRAWIFSPSADHNNEIRWSWVEDCLLGDLRTFRLGIELNRACPELGPSLGRSLGGGNFSLSVLVTTAIEYLARLYCGDSWWRPNEYSAGLNVARFTRAFFSGYSRLIPITLWQTVRNGLHHMFQARMDYRQRAFTFAFGIDDARVSCISKSGTGLHVQINSLEYLDALERAVVAYKARLETEESLQGRFVKAYRAVAEVRWIKRRSDSRHNARFERRARNEVQRLDQLPDGGLRLLFSDQEVRRLEMAPPDRDALRPPGANAPYYAPHPESEFARLSGLATFASGYTMSAVDANATVVLLRANEYGD